MIKNLKKRSLTIVVWLLKSATNACKLLKQVFNHLPRGGFEILKKNGTLV
jgi:hypothetical protein